MQMGSERLVLITIIWEPQLTQMQKVKKKKRKCRNQGILTQWSQLSTRAVTLMMSTALGASGRALRSLVPQFLGQEWLAGAATPQNTSLALQDCLSEIYSLKRWIYQLNLSAEMPQTSGKLPLADHLMGRTSPIFLACGTKAAQLLSPAPASHSWLHFI